MYCILTYIWVNHHSFFTQSTHESCRTCTQLVLSTPTLNIPYIRSIWVPHGIPCDSATLVKPACRLHSYPWELTVGLQVLRVLHDVVYLHQELKGRSIAWIAGERNHGMVHRSLLGPRVTPWLSSYSKDQVTVDPAVFPRVAGVAVP